MQQSISKRKLYYYFFILLALTTFHNTNLKVFFDDYFKIKKVEFFGLTHKEEKTIIDSLKISKYSNIFFLNKDILNKNMSKHKFIENYNIKKHYPSSLKILIKKTEILAITYLSGRKHYVGENGNFIKFDEIYYEKKLPIIFGNFKINDFLQLQKILKKQKIYKYDIENIFAHKSGRWDIKFNNGVIVMLPSDNLENAIINFKKISNKNEFKNENIFDFRVYNRVIISNG